ncbi:MAG TPA: FIST N-terminal domain-containing protein, partial [Tabrizicola sp.]|nr:FIST N-terminal domain-containing protein [Tabrizicola sp.]
MKIATAQSSACDPRQAMAEIIESLALNAIGQPHFVALHFGAGSEATLLANEARSAFPTAALHGGSSCFGIMTQAGVNISSGAGVGALAIWDAEGSYGTASADLGADARAAARQVTEAALSASGRSGEIPDLVWLTVAPGREEQVIEGIRSVVGPGVLIVGGSAADNDVSGQWAQFGPLQTHADGVVVSVLFPSVATTSAYESGYAPTGESGLATRVSGRRLLEIDRQP